MFGLYFVQENKKFKKNSHLVKLEHLIESEIINKIMRTKIMISLLNCETLVIIRAI